MADSAAAAKKHAVPVTFLDLKSLISMRKTRRTMTFLYGFMVASLVVTIFLAFSPSPNSGAPWLTNVFSVGNNGGESASGSQFSNIFSYLFPNGSAPSPPRGFSGNGPPATVLERNSTRSDGGAAAPAKNQTAVEVSSNATAIPSPKSSDQSKVSQSNQTTTASKTAKSLSDSDKSKVLQSNQTLQSNGSSSYSNVSQSNQTVQSSGNSEKSKVSQSNQTVESLGNSEKSKVSQSNQTVQILENSEKSKVSQSNQTVQSLGDSEKSKISQSNQTVQNNPSNSGDIKSSPQNQTRIPAPKSPPAVNKTASVSEEKKKKSDGAGSGVSAEQGKKVDDSLESLKKCDLFDGRWVRDDSYGLYYEPGSCTLIDEQFNCGANKRPDTDYLKFKWQPKGCSIPRLDGKKMLEMLKGKRLVYVGDSLNRNMWESLVCILKNSAKNQSNVFEIHGRSNFRNEPSYSFVFQDYKCTVEFFVTPFLVQEEKVKQKNAKDKEYLLIDRMSKSAVEYKTADIIVFNTGHWWTHEKTSKGEDYYKEGGQVHKKLDVFEAFRKAITTWSKWVDRNIDPKKSLMFFRGYSHSHFSGGQWNSGGACDSETVPINDEAYLRPYLPKMVILEEVLGSMKCPVTYLNVTKMTDFRKDGHPSMYRKQSLTEEERRNPLKSQDCSHWCLPGVPDTWNEILYAELLMKFGQNGQQKQQEQKKSKVK